MVTGARASSLGTGTNELEFYTKGTASTTIPSSGQAAASYLLGCDPIEDPADCALQFSGGAAGISYGDDNANSNSSIQVWARPGNVPFQHFQFLSNTSPFFFQEWGYANPSQGFNLEFSTTTLSTQSNAFMRLTTAESGGGSSTELGALNGDSYGDAGIYTNFLIIGTNPTINGGNAGPGQNLWGISTVDGAAFGGVPDGGFYINSNDGAGASPFKIGANSPNHAIDIETSGVQISTNTFLSTVPTNKALCLNASGQISTCSSAVGSDGSCTCN